jgi:hypothetical protein
MIGPSHHFLRARMNAQSSRVMLVCAIVSSPEFRIVG